MFGTIPAIRNHRFYGIVIAIAIVPKVADQPVYDMIAANNHSVTISVSLARLSNRFYNGFVTETGITSCLPFVDEKKI